MNFKSMDAYSDYKSAAENKKTRSQTEHFLTTKTSLVQEIKIKADNSRQLGFFGWADIRPQRSRLDSWLPA